MFPEERHANLGDMVHGGAILTFIDMALFAGGRLAGANVMRAVTLDLSTRFLSPGRIGVPLDAEVELLRETKRLAFFAGKVVQEGELVAAFSGALRKSSREPNDRRRRSLPGAGRGRRASKPDRGSGARGGGARRAGGEARQRRGARAA